MCSRRKQMDRSSNSSCRSSCVKLYLCSNPEDSIMERRALRESVFPELREQCRHTLGVDFRVIDPYESSDPSRWPDDNSRQQLIKECRESSAGPFLLSLVGHQYGKASLPAQVEVPEYQLLLQESQQAGVSTKELERVYKRDENTIPPSYCLTPSHRHTCGPQQADVKEEEENKMEEKEEELRKVLKSAVTLCVHNDLLTAEKAHKYYRSALDADLRFALEDRPRNDIIRRCIVYVHTVINAKGEQVKGQMSSKLEPQSEAEATPESSTPTDRELLSEMCDSFLRGLITSCRLLVYTTTTECDRRHGYTTARRRGYAESLCQQVYSDLAELIGGLNVSETGGDSHPGDTLAREQAEQEELCTTLSRFYDVIRPEEEEIKAFVEQSDHQGPLVITGGPCAGMTVLLAHCAQQIKSWLQDNSPVVITYFTNFSSNPSLKHLLSSLCYQIISHYSSSTQGTNFYIGTEPDDPNYTSNQKDSNCSPPANLDPHHEPNVSDCNPDLKTVPCPVQEGPKHGVIKPDVSLSELKKHLSSLMSLLPSPKQPLVLILDGLDQIGNSFAAQIIESLPSPLPPGVKLILSVSSNQTPVLQAVGLHYPQCSPPPSVSEVSEKKSGYVCVRLGLADRKQCVKMLTSLLSSSGKRVTSGQQALVNQALVSCCLTLYARLLHVHTSLWHSDSEVTESSLHDGVHSSISALLDHLEQKHTSGLVACAVSYLSLSRAGITEAELTDLVSSNGNILVEQDQRVTQVDVEKLLLDLKSFLIRRTVTGSQVLLWVSRHFRLVIAKRYLGTREARREIHSEMADYFSGRGPCGSAKRLLEKQKSAVSNMYIDRQPCSQPFVFTSSSKEAGRVNLRKIIELPHHLQESDKWEELEQGLLMSLGFHQAMVQARLLGDLVAMLMMEERSSTFTFSRERALLASILTSSACVLQSSPMELPTVMEMNLFPFLEVFPALKGYVGEIRQERMKRSSGIGVVLSPAPSTVAPIQCLQCDAGAREVSVTEATATECGIVAEIMDDCSAWIWKGSGCDIAELSLRGEQEEVKFAGVKSSGQFMLLSTQCNKLFLWDVTGPEMFLELKDPLKTEFAESSKQNKIKGFVACQKKLCVWWTGASFVSLFDASGETVTPFQCQSCVTCVVCSANGSYMYCGQEGGIISIFDTDSNSLLGTCSNSNRSMVVSIILCEDKQEMACVDSTGEVTLWDVAAKTQSRRLAIECFTGDKPNIVLNTDYSDEINTLLVCQHNQVTMWDTCDWKLWDQFLAPRGRAFIQAVLSQDGHLLLALLDTCPLVLAWRVSTGECVLSLETIKQPLTLLKVASDVTCVTRDGCLLVWDSEMIYAAGAALKMRRGVKEVVVEETGEWFYTTDGSEAVWKWSLETGFPHTNFLHDSHVEKLRVSPNNIRLVTLSVGEIYVWVTETGQNILRISGSRATDILITPNGNFGVSISDRGLSRVWKMANGGIVCKIHLYLSDAQVSPESTFLIGCRHGDLLAASLWSGTISKRFSCVESSEQVVAFHTLSEHPDFVVVMVASGSLYTWNISEETMCQHFELPETFHCQPQDFQMSSDGSYALLSTDNGAITLLDLSQVRLCSFKVEGPVIKACLDKTGGYAAYIFHPTSMEKSCVCYLHARPILTVVRLSDGERVGSMFLSSNPLTLVMYEQQCVFVGFEDGSVGVYSISDLMIGGEGLVGYGENLNGQLRECAFDKEPYRCLPLAIPNMTWP
ncbi:NACHT and WD repeat domain-containing protein 2-like [Scomber scombrus]|nr:NACHT and WD repeat domain-containing protein 2-like [Scomber scombrus]